MIPEGLYASSGLQVGKWMSHPGKNARPTFLGSSQPRVSGCRVIWSSCVFGAELAGQAPEQRAPLAEQQPSHSSSSPSCQVTCYRTTKTCHSSCCRACALGLPAAASPERSFLCQSTCWNLSIIPLIRNGISSYILFRREGENLSLTGQLGQEV